MGEAQRLFDLMPPKDQMSWSIVMTAMPRMIVRTKLWVYLFSCSGQRYLLIALH
jgi:hypothetical protein